jgi:hypothetical protein
LKKQAAVLKNAVGSRMLLRVFSQQKILLKLLKIFNHLVNTVRLLNA